MTGSPSHETTPVGTSLAENCASGQMIGRGTGFGAGSCGELVQGVTSDGVAFQVSLPIDIGATVQVVVDDADSDEVVGLPNGMTKTRAAIAATLNLLGASPKRVRVHHHTALPIGKGMGSSTADIVAAARAIAKACGQRLSADDLARLAGAIEPSDGAMYERMAVLQRTDIALRTWSWSPSFTAVVLVAATSLSTDRADVSRMIDAGSEYDTLLDGLEDAVARRDPRPFVAAAATSARLHRELVGNGWIPRIDELAVAVDARGWNIAHTGTAAGLLFDADDVGRRAARAAAVRLRRELRHLRILTVAAGAAQGRGAS